MFNVEESIKGQKEFCEKSNCPKFAPPTGVCWSCHKNIYEEVQHNILIKMVDRKSVTTGISTEAAKTGLITGCPHCHRSYCD